MSQTSRHLQRIIKSIPLSKFKQGSTLSIQSSVPLTRLEIQSQWRDDGHAQLTQITRKESLVPIDMSIMQNDDQETSMGRLEPHFSISLDKAAEEFLNSEQVSSTEIEKGDQEGTVLSLHLPEKANLVCNLAQGGSIDVLSKIEGDVQLSTTKGNICVKKLRGHEIQLTNAKGHVHVKDVMEAQSVKIEAGRIRAKQIHGTSIQLSTVLSDVDTEPMENDDEGSLIDVSSIYISGAGGATAKVSHDESSDNLKLQRRAIRIKSSHGPLRAETIGLGQPQQINPYSDEQQPYPLVELGGVNGNCELEILNSQQQDVSTDWTSCSVHVDSLSPDSVSLISSDSGNIQLTVDRKVESDLRLLSLPQSADCMAECVALLAEEEDPSHIINILKHLPIDKASKDATSSEDRIAIETGAFTARKDGALEEPMHLSDGKLQYVDGWVDNKSSEPDSRFERKLQNDALALQGHSRGGGKIRIDSAADQALYGFSSQGDNSGSDQSDSAGLDPEVRPLLAAIGKGRVKVETLSWFGAIARRYGMGEEFHRGLGRQATRRGRSLLSPDDE